MDHIKLLVQKLASAANRGEDNSVLLALVEELKMELTQPAAEPVVSESIAIVMPDGFGRKPVARSSSAASPILNRPGLSVPRPPAIVLAEEPEQPSELPATELAVSSVAEPFEYVQEPAISSTSDESSAHNHSIIPEVLASTQQEFPIVSKDEPGSLPDEPIAEQVVATIEPERESAVPQNMELPLTPEMIAEAIALEMLAINPVDEPEWRHHHIETQEQQPKELNERIAQRSKMLNEVFTASEPELVEVLAKPKIADLRKSISINEKYQFIGSLFRGDEDMFERSIKTLNNFSVMQEAQYWMQRELLIKLGWNEDDELVQRFFELVSRRFS